MPYRNITGWETQRICGNPLVSLVISSYEQVDELLCLLYSLRCQTYDNWEALVIHDGPSRSKIELVQRIRDDRVNFYEMPERLGAFGAGWRDFGIATCKGRYIGLSSGDNYYCPVYFEAMLHKLTVTPCDIVYCDFIHSHRKWSVCHAEPRRHFIDLGCFIGKAEIMKRESYPTDGFDADGIYFDKIAKGSKIEKLDYLMYVHN